MNGRVGDVVEIIQRDEQATGGRRVIIVRVLCGKGGGQLVDDRR